MKSAAARPSESVDDGNFHGKLEPSVPILFISLLQIRDGSEALLGTPSSFLLLPAPRVGHMWATGLRDLLQGCPGVAQPGLLWSRIRACQEMISSSSRSGPTFAHPALLDCDRPRLISSEEEAACSRESRIPSALPLQHWIRPRAVPSFQVGLRQASSLALRRGNHGDSQENQQEHPGQLYFPHSTPPKPRQLSLSHAP